MLRLTRTAIGLLTAQYRSVLRKCWAINVGVFALGAIAATVPTEAQAVTAADLGTSDNITWTSVSGTGTNVITVNYPSPQYWRYTINESAYGTNYKNRTVNQNINTTNEYIAGGVYNYSSASTTNITNGLFYCNNVTYTNSSTSDIKGLIFYNSGNIGQFAADVVNNTSTYTDTNSSWKHAKGNFYNSGVIEAIIGDFINNSLRRETGFDWDFADGGAMYLEGTVGSITGNFVGNSISSSSGYGAWGYGGALYLNGAIGDIKGNFISNKITVNSPGYSGQSHGGAIFIEGGTVNSIDGDFIDNSINFTGSGSHGAVTGGAIYNAGKIKDIKGKFQGNNMVLSSDHNYSAPSGGAALNNQSNIHHIVSDFVKNTTTLSAKVIWVAGRSYDVYGALFNGGVIDQIDGSFKDNIVTHSLTGTSSSDTATTPISSYGGGLANLGRATVNADFSGNQIKTTISRTIGKAYAYGGAIYNSSTLNVKDSSFTNNTATATGGATAVAQGGGLYNSGTATFTGYNNFANNRANGVLNDIYNSNGTITIAGTTTLNSGYNGDNNSSTSLTINDHATFNLNESNGEIHRNQNLGALTNNGTFNLSLDLKSDGTSDSFIVASTPSSNEIIVTAIKAIGTLTPGRTWTILSGSGASSTGAHLRLADLLIANPTITSAPIADAIMASTPWEENYYAVRWTEEGNILNMDLTPNKLGIIYRSQAGIAEVQRSSSLGDTLYLVNTDATNATKTFSTSDATKVYSATFTPGTTRGTVNIQGARSGDNISTIDLNGFEGFKVDSDATLNITDAKLINGAKSASTIIGGSAIYNEGNINNLNADFEHNSVTNNNSSGALGSAILNNGTISSIGNADNRAKFTQNSLFVNTTSNYVNVGATVFNANTIGTIYGDFIGNSILMNSQGWVRGATISQFLSSDTVSALGKRTARIENIYGSFTGNYIIDTNSADVSVAVGSAIHNKIDGISDAYAIIDNINADFIDNYIKSSVPMGWGGAIFNGVYHSGRTEIGNISGKFKGNYVQSSSSSSTAAYGGAIANISEAPTSSTSSTVVIGNISANFDGNYAESTSSGSAYGGAIYNEAATISNIKDSTFTNNYVTSSSSSNAKGGAIYNTGGTNAAITFTGTNTFTNNKANGSLNDIYNNSGTITIASGTTKLNSGYTGTDSATLTINSGATFDLNENNGEIHSSNLGNVTNNDTFKLGVDITAAATDTFNFASYTGSGSIILDAIHAIAGAYTLNQDYTVLTGTTGSAVLTLPSNTITSKTSSSPVVIAITDVMEWDTKYTTAWTDTVETFGVTLTGDQKGFKITSREVTEDSNGRGDVLAALNQNTDYDTKTFTAVNSDAGRNYTTTESLGNTNGTLWVNGIGVTPAYYTTLTPISTADKSAALTIGNGLSGFDIGSGSEVNLQNLALKGGTSNYVANITGGTLGLNNVDVDSASVIKGTSGNLNLNGNNTISASLENYTGTTTVESGTTDFENTANGFTVEEPATVKIAASNIAGAVTNDGTLNLSSGTLSNNISGSGTTSVAGEQSVTNNATISSALNNAGTLTNSATISGATTNTGTLDNNGTLSGTVNNSGTLMTTAGALTGSSVTNTGTLELEGGNLTTSLLGTGRMKLMSGRVRLLSSTPPATTGSLSFGDSDDDVFVNSILTSSSRISTSNNAIATGGYLDNNYYRKNEKSEILNGFEGWKTGNENDDNLSKLAANDNFHLVNDGIFSNQSTTFDAKVAENVPAAELRFNIANETGKEFAKMPFCAPTVAGTSIFFWQKNIEVLDNFYKNSQCLKASNDNFAITIFLRAI